MQLFLKYSRKKQNNYKATNQKTKYEQFEFIFVIGFYADWENKLMYRYIDLITQWQWANNKSKASNSHLYDLELKNCCKLVS